MTVAHDPTHWHTHTYTGYDFPGQEIDPSQKPLTCATHNIHNRQRAMASGGIRTCNPSKREAADLGLRPRGNRDWCLRCFVRRNPNVDYFVHAEPSVHGAVHVNLTLSCLFSYLFGAGSSTHFLKSILTLNPLTWKIRWAPNNASRRQMGFKSAFKVLLLTSNLPI